MRVLIFAIPGNKRTKVYLISRFCHCLSLPVARVKFESGEKKSFFFSNVILTSFDCSSCFLNVAPIAAQNINSPRDNFPVERSRELIPGVGSNY